MRSPERFRELLDDYVGDKTGSEERVELAHLVRSGEFQGLLEEHITVTFGAEDLEGPVLTSWQKEKILDKIFAEARLAAPVIEMRTNRRQRFTWRWAAAAAILVTVTVGAGLYFRSLRSYQVAATKPVDKGAAQQATTIDPGGYKAILTLADASEVVLDDSHRQYVGQQGNTRVSNVDGKELVYTGQATEENSKSIVYNKVSTPRGGQYQIVLPDGSKVWLNAASTLRFPIAFAGEERNVLLTGEAYFEINSRPAGSGGQQRAPFTVTVNGTKVTVLGTHFNVMAYDDEKIMATTLLEGAVKISSGRTSSLLKPGQQAQIQSTATGLGSPAAIKVVKNADTQQAVAWKDGFFSAADVPAVMRQIARWYNLDVVYATGTPPVKQFDGKISRQTTIADLVTLLETNGIHVRVEKETRKLVVLN